MPRRALVGSGQLTIPLPPSMVQARPVPRALPVTGRTGGLRRLPAARPAAGAGRSRRLLLEVERVRSARGEGYRFTSPQRMRGWAAVAYTPQELAAALRQAQTEADIAGYARWRGSSYDEPDAIAAGQDRTPPPRAPLSAADRRAQAERPRSQLPDGAAWGVNRKLLRPDVADPAEWTVLPDGRLQSPPRVGRKPLIYGRDTTMGRRILDRRREAGLPVVA